MVSVATNTSTLLKGNTDLKYIIHYALWLKCLKVTDKKACLPTETDSNPDSKFWEGWGSAVLIG